MKAAFTALFALLLSFSAQADIHDDFQALKNVRKDYQAIGTICEEVARLQLSRLYQAPYYKVVTGIEYGNSGRTIGELDVIVFESRTGEAIKVAEVKCWKDMGAGLSKARKQRQRFIQALRSSQRLYFWSSATHEQFDRDQFDSIQEFASIAQKGATHYGYDDELEYSLSELMTLRAMLMECQDRGECAHP